MHDISRNMVKAMQQIKTHRKRITTHYFLWNFIVSIKNCKVFGWSLIFSSISIYNSNSIALKYQVLKTLFFATVWPNIILVIKTYGFHQT